MKVTNRDMDRIKALVNLIAPILRDQPIHVIGAALAEIVSLYFAGHNPTIREASIDIWLSHMRELIPINETEILERHGMKGWPGQ